MSAVWVIVASVGVATVAMKAAGPLLLGGTELPHRLTAVLQLVAPSVLAALVVTQTVGGDRALVFDERIAGVAVAAVALRLGAPVFLVIALAAVVTAVLRAV